MAAMKISEAAAGRLREIARGAGGRKLVLGTRSGGCAGLRYDLRLEDAVSDADERVDFEGGQLHIEAASLLHLLGAEMDWRPAPGGHAFVWINPNMKSSCGCGESFAC